MEAQYQIVFTLRTGDNWHPYAQFFIGNDSAFAYRLFHLLQGSTDPEEPYPLTIDLVETIDGLPSNLRMIHCNLPQLGDNTKMITRELFRHAALK